MVRVGERGLLPHRKGRDSGEQHFTAQAHRQKNTLIKLLQNKTIMLVSQVYSHTYARYFALKKNIYIYIVPRSTNVLSFLHNSVIWIWWGSAPPAPNVETPLHTLIIQTHTHTHSHTHTDTETES